jgi:hypothetical protein
VIIQYPFFFVTVVLVGRYKFDCPHNVFINGTAHCSLPYFALLVISTGLYRDFTFYHCLFSHCVGLVAGNKSKQNLNYNLLYRVRFSLCLASNNNIGKAHKCA